MLARFAKTLVSMTAEQLADTHKKVQRDLLFGCCVWGGGCGLVWVWLCIFIPLCVCISFLVADSVDTIKFCI